MICNYPLNNFNTFNIKNYAIKIIIVNNLKKLCKIWQKYKKKNLPCLILGKGSNVLFLNDFYGIVIINKIKGIYISELPKYWNLHINSGENWHELVKYTIENKIYGLENLALIPGSVGSAPIQNIGAYGASIKDFCQYVDIINPINKKIYRINKKECKFQYRDSIFKYDIYKKNYVIISIGLLLSKKWIPNLNYKDLKKLKKNNTNPNPQKIFNYICNIRKKKIPNPKIYGNAGSFFKNPFISLKLGLKLLKIYPQIPISIEKSKLKLSAGWLIDQCKFKGYIRKGVMVHSKQSLIILNKSNNATGMDILKLAIKIYNAVGIKFNIWLEPEVKIINSYGEVHPSIFFKKN
ncbi:UDP-N-acetylmuramate dehydrogenase [Enterobacteriaceae endosymbiont of Donacia versicolorea]|uniref:UDP-N-acetylmuramate dehydrogenase n=1 Tax=Enterobacteriaceae endosymbiont of Donacia versicolorea TaxID=2675788 RepID=UPI001448FF0E|nr:UDP-N-acetylmuramate dehydrogenase [Enterobacteriaceae endosymbiont of Donacia versicolorea]QJC31892.1 UDP-N-acetylmuramate dehydrogenase [Enterobacteriaceae endosymbiont of Donacia versicolorea]